MRLVRCNTERELVRAILVMKGKERNAAESGETSRVTVAGADLPCVPSVIDDDVNALDVL